MSTAEKSLQTLYRDVIQAGLCTGCGSCAGMCPYVVSSKGRIVNLDNCDLEGGRCYSFCPRVSLDMDSLSQAVFGAPLAPSEIGTTTEIRMSRTTDPDIRARAQHGGTVSTLICLALETGFIESAVLARSDNCVARGAIASSRAEVLACAGSSFVPSASLEAFNQEARNPSRRIGFVGLPCQVLALAKRKSLPSEARPAVAGLKLTIGLFCTWSLLGEVRNYLAGVMPLSEVRKMDIPSKSANVFELYGPEGVRRIPLDEVRKFINPACAVCPDMTAEFADISVGVARGLPQWNTVIVRTETGRTLFEHARKAGLLEVSALAAESLDNLKHASLRKRQKAIQELVSRTGTFAPG